jgi:hypothetical protein
MDEQRKVHFPIRYPRHISPDAVKATVLIVDNSSRGCILFKGRLLADQKHAPLISAQKGTEFGIVVTRFAGQGTLYPPPQHCIAAQHVWLLIESGKSACSYVQKSGPHEILAIAVADAMSISGLNLECRQLSLICVLLNLRRARLIDPIDAALDGPLVRRRFPQSTPLQHFQEPCEWQTRWQMSSPSSRRPIPHGGLLRG